MVEDISFEPRFIKDIEVHDLGPSTKVLRLTLKVVVGGVVRSYPTISVSPDATPRWLVNLSLDNIDTSTEVKLILYRRHPFWLEVLGSTEKTISDFFEEENDYKTFPIFHDSSTSPTIASFRISYSDDIRVVSVKTMMKDLREVDFVADIAWCFLSKGIDILRKNKESNKVVVDLYKAMFSAYVSASRAEEKENAEVIRSCRQALIRQTIECTLFIEGYARKITVEHPLSAQLLDKAVKFREGFMAMDNLFQSTITKEVEVVTLGVQVPINRLVMRGQLDHLRVFPQLGPKSTCLRGTRGQTINALMSWIAECSGGVLWVNGVSGSGKSSLMGTLRELAINASGRKRLGAFIRYDRMESPDSSKLITTIAYLLGMSDNRIGMAISLVAHGSPSLASSEKERFELLIEQPLRSVPVLADEGPLVVIIDGLDECNPSDELLAVLANGFGSRLPFMRMVIASRPLESIVWAFSHSGITPITLDTSSEATRRDIRYYIDHQLSSIFADQEARHAPDTLQRMCEALIAVEGLSKRANGSFVWAVTACRFIREFPTITRLQTLLGLEILTDCTDSIANLYKAILSLIVAEADEDKDVIRRCICTVLGAIMIPRRSEGMTAEILDDLVLVPGDPPAYLILADLGAVVQVSLDGFARFFDMSFYDFLRDRDRCGEEWYIDVEERKKVFDERLSCY